MDNQSQLSAKELLEKLQIEYIKMNTHDIPNHEAYSSVSFLNTIAKKACKKYDINVDEMLDNLTTKLESIVLNTKYQDPLEYMLLCDIVKDIENVKQAVFENTGILNMNMPFFGTVQSFNFAANVRSVNFNENLIVISSGLFTFANLISKIIAHSLPFVSEENGRMKFSANSNVVVDNIQNNKAIKARFFDLMLACIFTNQPPCARQYFPEPKVVGISAMFLQAFETFVVAHEYAHSALGHLDAKNIQSVSKITLHDNSVISYALNNWSDEVMADTIGAGLTLAVMSTKGFDEFLSMAGIIICTNSFELFEKMELLRSNKCDGIKISVTHPPSKMRREALEEFYYKDSDTSLFQTIDKIFEVLWFEFVSFLNIIKPRFEKMFKSDFWDLPFPLVQSVMYKLLAVD